MDANVVKGLSTDSLLVVAFFVVPGYIALKAWASVAVAPAQSDRAQLLSAVATSVLVLAPIGPLLYWAYTTHWLDWTAHPIRDGFFGAAILCVWPALLGLLIAKATRTAVWAKFMAWFRVRPSEPRAWDSFFMRGEPCFARVVLKDGSFIGGAFVPGASASSHPGPEDLYLAYQFRMEPDGTFGPVLPRSRGCWVDMTNAQFVEFFTLEEMSDEQVQGSTDEVHPGYAPAESGQRGEPHAAGQADRPREVGSPSGAERRGSPAAPEEGK